MPVVQVLERPSGLERWGASDAFAGALLEPLRLNGWSIGEAVPAFGGGVLLIAELPAFGFEFRAVGGTRSEAAVALFEQIAPLMSAGDVQLSIPIPAE